METPCELDAQGTGKQGQRWPSADRSRAQAACSPGRTASMSAPGDRLTAWAAGLSVRSPPSPPKTDLQSGCLRQDGPSSRRLQATERLRVPKKTRGEEDSGTPWSSSDAEAAGGRVQSGFVSAHVCSHLFTVLMSVHMCSRLLMSAHVCSLFTCAHACSRLPVLTPACVSFTCAHVCSPVLTPVHVCFATWSRSGTQPQGHPRGGRRLSSGLVMLRPEAVTEALRAQ